MATYYSDAFQTDGTPRSVKYDEKCVYSVTGTFALGAALALNDVIKMCPVHKGVRVIDVVVSSDDLDTGTAIMLTVGDTDGTPDPDRYITASNVGQAGGVARMNNGVGHHYRFAEQGTVDVTVSTGPTTGATSGSVKVTVLCAADGTP